MAKQDFNVGSVIADTFKGVSSAKTEQEAMGVKSDLEYPDPIKEEPKAEEPKAETKEETPTPEKDEVKDKAEETEEIAENESAEETESSLHTEKSDDVQTESKDEPVLSTDEEISTRTEGKYESLEDLLEAVNTPVEETKFEYGNELIAKLDELAKQGIDVNLDFVKAQMVDYSTYDVENVNQAKKLIEMELRQNEPDITQREIDFEMRKYKLDADEYDEDDVELSKIQLMRDAKRSMKSLKEAQDKMAIPTGGVDPEVQRQQEEIQQRNTEKLQSTLKDAVKSYEKETLQIGDESFDYELTKDVKKSLEKTLLNTNEFFHKYINKDGSIDTSSLRSDMLWLTNKEAMLNAYLSQATAKGGKDVVTDIKNTDFSKTTSTPEIKDRSVPGAISNHFKDKKF